MSRGVVWGLTALAAVGLLATSGLAWSQVSGEGAVAGAQTVITGTELSGGLSRALAVVPALGLLLSLTLRVRGRQLLGVLLVVVGLAAVALTLPRPELGSAVVTETWQRVSLEPATAVVSTTGRWLYAVAGGLLVVTGALTTWLAPRWPVRAARYEKAPGPEGEAAPGTEPADLWRALDRGEDPTDRAARGTRFHSGSGETTQ